MVCSYRRDVFSRVTSVALKVAMPLLLLLVGGGCGETKNTDVPAAQPSAQVAPGPIPGPTQPDADGKVMMHAPKR